MCASRCCAVRSGAVSRLRATNARATRSVSCGQQRPRHRVGAGVRDDDDVVRHRLGAARTHVQPQACGLGPDGGDDPAQTRPPGVVHEAGERLAQQVGEGDVERPGRGGVRRADDAGPVGLDDRHRQQRGQPLASAARPAARVEQVLELLALRPQLGVGDVELLVRGVELLPQLLERLRALRRVDPGQQRVQRLEVGRRPALRRRGHLVRHRAPPSRGARGPHGVPRLDTADRRRHSPTRRPGPP
jgi:hypothetical protein